MQLGNFAKLKDIDEMNNIVIPEKLAILPLRDFVVYPHMVSPLIIARTKSLRMIDKVMETNQLLGLIAQKDANNENPKTDSLFNYGTAAFVLKRLRFPDNSVRILVQGLTRFRIVKFLQKEPYFEAKIKKSFQITGSCRSSVSSSISLILVDIIFTFSFYHD